MRIEALRDAAVAHRRGCGRQPLRTRRFVVGRSHVLEFFLGIILAGVGHLGGLGSRHGFLEGVPAIPGELEPVDESPADQDGRMIGNDDAIELRHPVFCRLPDEITAGNQDEGVGLGRVLDQQRLRPRPAGGLGPNQHGCFGPGETAALIVSIGNVFTSSFMRVVPVASP